MDKKTIFSHHFLERIFYVNKAWKHEYSLNINIQNIQAKNTYYTYSRIDLFTLAFDEFDKKEIRKVEINSNINIVMNSKLMVFCIMPWINNCLTIDEVKEYIEKEGGTIDI